MRTQFAMRINKWITSSFGVLLILIGAPFLILSSVYIYRFFYDASDQRLAVIAAIGVAVGTYCVWTGLRMVFGIQRKEGGLLSPFALRTAGVLFAIVPLVLLFIDGFGWSSILRIFEIGFFFVAAAACFGLASRRQHRVLGGKIVDGDT